MAWAVTANHPVRHPHGADPHQGADDSREILTVIRSAITAWRCAQFELASCPQLALYRGQPLWAF